MEIIPARSINPALSQTLDASRWVAASLVVLYHVRMNVMVEPDQILSINRSWLERLFYTLSDCGPQAVIWFFVISGFLVGGKVAADVQKSRFDFRSYAYNRLTRLYIVLIPALVICFSLDLLRVHVFGLNPGAGGETVVSYTPWTFFANLLCLQTVYAPVVGSNTPLWSLACEAWYYVLFPLMLLICVPSRLRWVAAGATVMLVILLSPNPKIFMFFTFWFMGVGLRFCPRPLMRSNLLAWIFVCIAAACYPLSIPHLKFIGMMLVALTFANVLLTAMYDTAAVSRFSTRIHALLAGFSYSLYLTHAPVLHFLNAFAHGQADPRLMIQPGLASLAITLGLFILLFAFAWIFSLVTEAQTDRVRFILRREPAARFLSILLVLVVSTAPSFGETSTVTPPPLTAPTGYTMTFDDEFDTLDLTRWRPYYPWGGRYLNGQGELQIYVDPTYAGKDGTPLGLTPFSVTDGILTISASPASADLLQQLQGQEYISGMLTSRTFAQTYGYFEIRAIFPAGQGLWPAFWMGSHASWPPEIDIVELIGSQPTIDNTTIHWTGPNKRHRSETFTTTVADYSKALHTYGVLWTARFIAWYVDGKRIAYTTTPNDMHQPMYLLLNLAVGGNWPGVPDASTKFPAKLQVDYIRAYALPLQ
jgi:beta-glucanase (GH16 family)/peptidoglycan/LPS O-acetylase OafA/YrhL